MRDALGDPRLERAIGVIYRPQTERQSHYFDARLAEQFDAVIHLDRTRARRTAGTDRRCGTGASRPRPTRAASEADRTGASRKRPNRAELGLPALLHSTTSSVA